MWPIASNRMILVVRRFGRVRGHSADIAEQVGFLLTGGFREFTDASHPVDGHGRGPS